MNYPMRLAIPPASAHANRRATSIAVAEAGFAVLVCLLIGVYSTVATPTSTDRWIIWAFVAGLGGALLVSKPTYLVDLFLCVVVTNRLVRRLLDWGEGRYDPTPIFSILTIATPRRWPLTKTRCLALSQLKKSKHKSPKTSC